MDLCFVIVGVALRQLLHRLEIGEHTRAMVDLVVVGIHRAQRVEIIALAPRLGAKRPALLERRCSLRKSW